MSLDEKLPRAKRLRPHQRLGLGLGIIASLSLRISPAPAGLGEEGWAVASVAVLMACWWATEALPVAATALLPLALFPLLGVGGIREAAEPFANPLVFLFLGGFLIAMAIERWRLHRRIALAVIARIGARPDRLVAGFMATAAGLSMWVSNTATTLVMLPIALSVVRAFLERESDRELPNAANFATASVLGIAYGASIGGLGTLIGTPPNALLAAFMLDRHGIEIGFAAWMAAAMPVVLVLLPLAWLVLTRVAFPFALSRAAEAAQVVAEARRVQGGIGVEERRVAVVFALVAAAWVGRPLLVGLPGLGGLTDPGIAVLGAVSLFLIPASRETGGFLLDWATARRIPWEVLILFGGGLSLAEAVSRTGLAAWLGAALAGLEAWPALALLAAVVTLVIVLTELTSNTATTAAFLPVVAALAVAVGDEPLAFAAPVALAASCAFMLPVATPPNAIVFGSGHVTIPQMVRAGALLNVLGIVVITLLPWVLLPLLF